MSDYGLKVVSSDGSTVIIDGTSNMFKISATGTLSKAFPAAGNAVTASTTLTGLGNANTTPPAIINETTDDSGLITHWRYSGFVANVDSVTGAVEWLANSTVHLDANPGQIVVTLQAYSVTTNPGTTAATRFYVLQEVGI